MPRKPKTGRPRNPGPPSNLNYNNARTLAAKRRKGMSWKDIAASAGVSPDTVRKWRARGEQIRDDVEQVAMSEDDVTRICNDVLTEPDYNGHDRHCYALVVLSGLEAATGRQTNLDRVDALALLLDRTGLEAIKYQDRLLSNPDDDLPADAVVELRGTAGMVDRLRTLFGEDDDE